MHSWSRIPWRLTRALYARYAFTSDRYLSRQESLLHPEHLAYWTLVIPFQERSQRLESRSTTAGKSIHSGASLYRQSLATTGLQGWEDSGAGIPSIQLYHCFLYRVKHPDLQNSGWSETARCRMPLRALHLALVVLSLRVRKSL